MRVTPQELRQAAKSTPLWQHFLLAAAEEIERLQNENELLRRVQDILDNAEEVDHALSDGQLNKIKADAVREYAKSKDVADCEALNYANKLERGT